MSTEQSQAQDSVIASSVLRSSGFDSASAGGIYTVVCTGADGIEKWSDTFHNLVVNEGLQDMNSKFFLGSGYTAAFYLGLITGPGSATTYAATDTLASHSWTENTNYAGNRKAVTFGAATTASPSVISNSALPSVFAINTNAQTIAGAFLCTVDTGTSGILFSAGDFTIGDKFVDSGDTLSVTYIFSLAAA